MTQEGVLYLTEADVVSTLDMTQAIDALEAMLRKQGQGQVVNVPKALGTWGDGSSMHALGSVMTQGGYCGFKTWVHTKRSGGSLFSLFDSSQGTLLALIEARAMGMMRTGAISGVATRLLAPVNVKVAALIGTGAQAVTQLAALAAVCPLDEVRVFSPTAQKCQAFVDKLAPQYPFALRACSSLEEAMQGATVATTITRATDPFMTPALLADCKHVNAVGAILSAKAEFNPQAMKNADLIVVDDVENAKRGSRELRELLGEQAEAWQSIRVLSDLLVNKQGRPHAAGLTLFKGMGMGMSDLAMAGMVYAKACNQGLGIKLPAQTRKNLLVEQAQQ